MYRTAYFRGDAGFTSMFHKQGSQTEDGVTQVYSLHLNINMKTHDFPHDAVMPSAVTPHMVQDRSGIEL